MNKRISDSFLLSFAVITSIATICTILGLSMKDIPPLNTYLNKYDWWLASLLRGLIVIGFYGLFSLIVFIYKGYKYKNSIELKIGNNLITIKYADIFEENAMRIIPVDTCFKTEVDNIIISKSSLHGQLVENHGKVDDINKAVKKAAEQSSISPDTEGKYHFELGTAIPYKGTDGDYILIALNELNEANEARTTLGEYESTLIRSWKEIRRVYAGRDIAIPLLGDGITSFDDDQGDPHNLLRCILCTLKTSKMSFNSKVSIVLYKKNIRHENLSLYEFRNLFQ